MTPLPPEIVVVDYDAGNLRSVQRALEAVGQRPLVTSDPRAVEHAEALVLPGVGSAQDCMRKLCLGILPGMVRRFENRDGLKVPQIGWNAVTFKYDHPLLDGIPGGSYFYFVHSYYADPADAGVTIGEAEYGVDFAAIVASENVVATQFHPEKSADMGLRIYANFGRIAAASRVYANSRD